jgi:uncharacterized protein (DUF849 family)
MSLSESGRVLIEVGLNELATKEQNPNVPYGPDEVAADMVRCIDAGATIVHFHARYDDGTQAWVDSEPSRLALDQASEKADVVAYPSYIGRLDHVYDLADRPGKYRLRFSPFDPSQHGANGEWDEASKTLSPIRLGGDVNESTPCPVELTELQKRGLIPNMAAFNSGDLRWILCAVRAGFLTPPVNLKLFFSDRWVNNNESDPAVLDFLVSRIPADVEHETVVVPYAMQSAPRADELLRRALDHGLGIRVGIGDNPLAFPAASNAELVEQAVALCRERGLTPASPAEFRERCDIGSDASRE